VNLPDAAADLVDLGGAAEGAHGHEVTGAHQPGERLLPVEQAGVLVRAPAVQTVHTR
jgi:hypothetical protein